jgi:hypothetical protein
MNRNLTIADLKLSDAEVGDLRRAYCMFTKMDAGWKFDPKEPRYSWSRRQWATTSSTHTSTTTRWIASSP